RPPSKVIRVPRELRPNTHYGTLNNLVKAWEAEAECRIIPKFDRGQISEFGLHGSGAQVDAGIRTINKWIEKACSKTQKSSSWAKTTTFHPNEWYYGELDKMEMERKHVFKQLVPDCEPPHRISMDWPKDLTEANITPQICFGNKLDSLNPIRVNDEVWISCRSVPPGRFAIDIQGFEQEHVEIAQEHFENMVANARSRQLMGLMILNVILDSKEGTEVILEDPAAQAWWPSKDGKVVPRLLTTPLDMGDFRTTVLHPMQIVEIQKFVHQSLTLIRCQRGTYSMKINFGCVALGGEKLPAIGTKHPLASFVKGINGPAEVMPKKWLYDSKDGQDLLARFRSSKDLLEPVKSISSPFGTQPEALEDIRPVFRGTWYIVDPNEGPPRPAAARNTGNKTTQKPAVPKLVVVRIEWSEDEDGEYEKMTPCYYQIKDGATEPQEHMDINLFELGQSRLWRFSLDSMDLLSKQTVSPVIIAFAESVSMKSNYDISSEGAFATWRTSPSVYLYDGCYMEKVYTYGIRGSEYRVDARQMWFSHQSKPCWGVTVRHRDWETLLNQLERLPTGHGADWKRDTAVETFFPD
ncbi:hypothetical protein BU24DRAFT_326190, partial [Aaosphaeria arxii CBS 175.79]